MRSVMRSVMRSAICSVMRVLVSLLAVGCGTALALGDGGGPADLARTSANDAGASDFAQAVSNDDATTHANDAAGSPSDLVQGGPNDLATSAGQTPPTTGAADLEPWLQKGYYKSWHCEMAPHDARPPGAHGRNRICQNDLLHADNGAGDRPVGAASVKELYDANDHLLGYAVSERVAAGGGGGNWYWYERNGQTTYADGTGGSGPAKTICLPCHSGAPRDFVWTQVN
jgi:hypothetical protein